MICIIPKTYYKTVALLPFEHYSHLFMPLYLFKYDIYELVVCNGFTFVYQIFKQNKHCVTF